MIALAQAIMNESMWFCSISDGVREANSVMIFELYSMRSLFVLWVLYIAKLSSQPISACKVPRFPPSPNAA